MNNLTQLKEQHKIDNGRDANKYEVEIYKALVNLSIIEGVRHKAEKLLENSQD